MLRSFFKEIPRELIEAAEIDGAGLRGQMTSIILPIAAPGIAATALLCVIFAWNEFFYAVQLNPVSGSTVPIWVTTNISTRGNFLAKLSAASVLACIPVVLAGWIAQKRMIRGLAMGAIKWSPVSVRHVRQGEPHLSGLRPPRSTRSICTSRTASSSCSSGRPAAASRPACACSPAWRRRPGRDPHR